MSQVPSDALLISCVYEKGSRPAAARDLYRGSLFERSRVYAEQQPGPWFILSGEHGLVRPTDWLAPYDTDLNDTSPTYRWAWGTWVVAKLERSLGGLDGLVVDIHAPMSYVEPILDLLINSGAELQTPLQDIPWDSWPDWYDRNMSE